MARRQTSDNDAAGGDAKASSRPSASLDRIVDDGNGLLREFGITRVGDLTGLDTIGVPVWFACRPNGRSLSVSQGKGLSARQARLSAVMEAIEQAAAERPRALTSVFGSPRDLRNRGLRTVDLERLPRCRIDLFDPGQERAWVRGVSAANGSDVLAPFELVGLDFRIDMPWDRRAFRMTSEGLAAGPDFNFAATRAVLELIENDSAAPVEAFGLVAGPACGLDAVAGVDPGIDRVLAKLDRAGVAAEIVELGDGRGLPVAAAFIGREVPSADGFGRRVSAGFACRFTLVEAVLAALLEAVQSRLTQIAGARDDLAMRDYAATATPLPRARARENFADRRRRYPIPPAGAALRLKRAIETLRRTPKDDVFLFPLLARPGLHVVRALAYGLEGSADGRVQRIGARGLQALFAPKVPA